MANLPVDPTVDLDNPEEVKLWLDNIEMEYSYGCLKQKDPDLCARLGAFYESIRERFEYAGRIYKNCCESYKNPNCCYKLAQFHHLGKGKIKKDYVKAFQCYNITCEQEPTDGDPSGKMRIANGCAMKAIMLNDGSLTDKEIATEMKTNDRAEITENIVWSLKRACEFNDPKACSMLGQYLFMGKPHHGVPQTRPMFAESVEYLAKSCELGVPQSCHNLGIMYNRGDGVKQNREKQKYYEEKAAEFTTGSFSMNFGSTTK